MSELENIINNEKDINKLKILLANEATKILHGEKAAKDSEITAKETFHGVGVSKNLPEINISQTELHKGNGIKINDELIVDEKKIITESDFDKNNFIKVSYGKKKHFVIKVS